MRVSLNMVATVPQAPEMTRWPSLPMAFRLEMSAPKPLESMNETAPRSSTIERSPLLR